MTLLETLIDIQIECDECSEEFPEEGKFKRWRDALEQVIEALKFKEAIHGKL